MIKSTKRITRNTNTQRRSANKKKSADAIASQCIFTQLKLYVHPSASGPEELLGEALMHPANTAEPILMRQFQIAPRTAPSLLSVFCPWRVSSTLGGVRATSIYVNTHTHTHAHTHTHTNTHTYTYTYTQTHIHTQTHTVVVINT